MVFRSTNDLGVMENFTQMKIKKTLECDGISNGIAKCRNPVVENSKAIASIRFIVESMFPKIWKRVKVVPIQKKGDRTRTRSL